MKSYFRSFRLDSRGPQASRLLIATHYLLPALVSSSYKRSVYYTLLRNCGAAFETDLPSVSLFSARSFLLAREAFASCWNRLNPLVCLGLPRGRPFCALDPKKSRIKGLLLFFIRSRASSISFSSEKVSYASVSAIAATSGSTTCITPPSRVC